MLHIRHDASSIDINNIASLLDKLDLPRKDDISWKLKLAWFNYADENAQANARASGGACCNRPPTVGGRMEILKIQEWHIHE